MVPGHSLDKPQYSYCFILPLPSLSGLLLLLLLSRFSRVQLCVTPYTAARQAPPSQGSNLGLLHRKQFLYRLSHEGSPSEKLNSPIMRHWKLVLYDLD